MENYNPEKIRQEVEEKEFGELATLSNTELWQLYEDAYHSELDTRGVQAIVIALLKYRGSSIGEVSRD